MKLDGHRLGLAGAAASSIFFTGCSILMHFWPESMIDMSAAMFHLNNFGPLTQEFGLNAQIFVSGLAQWAVSSYIYLYLFAYAYNHISTQKTVSKKS